MAECVPLVLVHGGCHDGTVWADTVAALRELQPSRQVLVVNLPGRHGVEGDLATLTLDACVAAVVAQIEKGCGGNSGFVLVGHSLAGTVMPGVVQALGAERVCRVIAVDCCLPPPGQSILDTLPVVVRALSAKVLRRPVIARVPVLVERLIFGNKATRADRAKIREGLRAESTVLITGAMPDYPELQKVAVDWVMSTRDRAMPPRRQRAMMRTLQGLDRVVSIDAGHEVLITHPEELARALVELSIA